MSWPPASSIGPGVLLQSFVMIAELSGSEAVNELLPRLAEELDAETFETLKRRVDCRDGADHGDFACCSRFP